MGVFVKSCCRAIGMTLALVCSTYYMVQHDRDESGWEPINVYGFLCAYKF